MSLIIRSSSIHAAGCYTTAPIRKRTRIVEYTGPHISKERADEKYQDSPTTYLFGLGNGETVIDGFENAPRSLAGLFRGDNLGKMLLHVAD